jgi:small subunit ribosomal protein S1
MSNPPRTLEGDKAVRPDSQTTNDMSESFGDILSQYEQTHSHRAEDRSKGLQGSVIAVTGDSVFLDIGFKTEGVIPVADFTAAGETVKPGDKVAVSIKGRGEDGYYQLSRLKVERPKDWSSLEQAFADKAAIAGVVSAVVKGGVSVDVGVRAFMPASRSGAKDPAEMEKLIGQEIRCRIIKLDVADEDVVVDRRAVLEEEDRATRDRRYTEVKEGETVHGVVRSLTDYGAFVDIGGVDALLHVADISWARIAKPADALTVGQEVDAKVLKVDPSKRRISLGLKQLLPHPWETVGDKYKTGDRVNGVVTRVAEFGAFVEIEKGVEGLIHLSEMSWSKKVRKAADVVKPGDQVDDVPAKFPVGSVVEGAVTSLTNFGAFVQLAEGLEGMIHIGDISVEKRINHPQEALKVGQVVKAQVLEADVARRRLRLGMKQLVPTSLDEYIAEHKEGDVVTGRMTESSGGRSRVELGEGVQGVCRVSGEPEREEKAPEPASKSISSLTSMLEAKWKGGQGGRKEPARSGQVRSFRIVKLDAAAKKIELELA